MIYLGTSGFSYKEWKGVLYPDDLPQSRYLHYYSRQFNSTEINNTFYRIPSEKMTAGWATQVPEGFRFALKLTQRITHRKKLVDCREEMEWFLHGSSPLAQHLGCILVQLPPWFKRQDEVLEDFLGQFGRAVPLALEFRHDSWFDDATFDLLARHNAALAVVESDEREAVREVTAPFLYMRLRKSDYAPSHIRDWAAWIRGQDRDVYVYLKHAAAAPELARQLRQALEEM